MPGLPVSSQLAGGSCLSPAPPTQVACPHPQGSFLRSTEECDYCRLPGCSGERKRGTLGSVSLTTWRAQHKAPSSSIWLSSIFSILPPKKTLPRVVQESAPKACMATAGLTCCPHKYLRKLSPAGTRAWGVHWGICLGAAAPKGRGYLPRQWPSGLLEQRQPSSPTPHFRSRPEASPPRQSAQH